jgi:hypothetical protein
LRLTIDHARVGCLRTTTPRINNREQEASVSDFVEPRVVGLVRMTLETLLRSA